LGFQRPQEDEWAMCVLGLPSLYETAAFPNNLSHDSDAASLEDLAPGRGRSWIDTWTSFLRSVVYRAPHRRLVLKSPLHTARLDVLLALFPNARFVHIVRNPQAVFESTVRLWSRLAEDEGLQAPDVDRLRKFVLKNYVEMYRSFDMSRHKIAPERMCQIRYEDLVSDPVRQLRAIYEQLDLDPFETIEPVIRSLADEIASFETNEHRGSAKDAQTVRRYWRAYVERFGYGEQNAA
jgi:hypothetical protein